MMAFMISGSLCQSRFCAQTSRGTTCKSQHQPRTRGKPVKGSKPYLQVVCGKNVDLTRARHAGKEDDLLRITALEQGLHRLQLVTSLLDAIVRACQDSTQCKC